MSSEINNIRNNSMFVAPIPTKRKLPKDVLSKLVQKSKRDWEEYAKTAQIKQIKGKMETFSSENKPTLDEVNKLYKRRQEFCAAKTIAEKQKLTAKWKKEDAEKKFAVVTQSPLSNDDANSFNVP